MAHELTFEEIQNCKKVFDNKKKAEDVSADDAKMPILKLQEGLEELGFKMANEEFDEICVNMKLANEIDFPTFLRIAAIKFKQQEFVTALEDAFKAFDKANKQYLTYDELRSIITDFGPKISMDQADILLKELGVENNKKFKYKDFVTNNI
jgi:Ca2+-binding EF-hand superfamily protein